MVFQKLKAIDFFEMILGIGIILDKVSNGALMSGPDKKR